ncbi:heterokaryon incompatibility protein (HET) domain-containing protein [Pochonia chlamydosporia 170]|uniref:Heterokaryon incompatibility protein (HET) domain-containing protein n=1 Tax=Pochonia chlamydosporia 170 TaxID=1380566 RepID=A0A179FB85_METCM|nr:heterokaryon incompatibility protein (HET) domain-containing protein [Pochonia chlamydosporia 170]OAQ62716.1 heterokaryon incompatibility protein (HET) domain-containing protein [Pochonia chlamydosporia 170]
MFLGRQSNRSYEYDSVPDHSIRLFEVNVEKSTRLQSLVGSLKQTKLDQVPPFLALSYHWGNSVKDIRIDCDGFHLHITGALADALHRLLWFYQTGDNQYHFPTRLLWIDQVCINQNDIDERFQQVRLMGTIYWRAIRTVVWLGPSSPTCEGGWRLVDQIYDVFKGENPRAKQIGDIRVQFYSRNDTSSTGSPP